LLLLVRNAGQVVTKEHALQAIWPDTVVEEANLSQNIFLLRKLLGEKESGQKIILTRTGVGYSFLPEVREIEETPPPIAAPGRRWLAPAVVLGAVILGYASTVALSRRSSPVPNRKWSVSSRPGVESYPAISPDSSRLAFTWTGEDSFAQPSLYVQDLPAENAPLVTPKRLTQENTGRASCPAWSPDGKRIAFVKQGQRDAGIYLISSDGAGERKIRDLHPAALAQLGCLVTFSPDGSALAIASTASEPRTTLSRIALDTGAEESLVSAPPGDHSGDDSPAYSPDGRYLAFVRKEFRGAMELFIAATSANGRLTGEPQRLSKQKLLIRGLTWAPDSQSVVYAATRLGTVGLWRAAIDGTPAEPVPGGDRGVFPTSSKTVLSFAIQNENINIWRIPLSPAGLPESAPAQLLASTQRDEGPVFSRDGHMISFFSDRTGSYEIWTSEANGNAPRALTAFGEGFPALTDWSPDGRTILFDAGMPDNSQALFTIPSAGGKPRPLITGPARNATPIFSRDGRRIYFSSTRTGLFQIWRADPDGHNPVQMTKGGGLKPQEGDDGYLYYASQASLPEIRRIPVAGGEEQTVLANPRPRFFGHWAIRGQRIYLISQSLELWLYDVASRSSRKLMDLPRAPVQTPMLAVSPDGSSMIYSRIDSASGDLYVIDSFR
jgi:Tol biopolymer transport system component